MKKIYQLKLKTNLTTVSKISWLLLIAIFMIVTSIKSQNLSGTDYLSPKPNSIGNSIQTNIILHFSHTPTPIENFENYFRLNSGNVNIPFHFVPQNDPKKIILKPDLPLPIASTITVTLLNKIPTLESSLIEPFHFIFKTSDKTKETGMLNETWPKKANNPLSTVNKEAASNNGIGKKISEDINNLVPFNMTISKNDTNDYFLVGSMYSTLNNDRNVIINGRGEILYDLEVPFVSTDFKMHADSSYSYALLSDNETEYCFVTLDKNFQPKDTIQAGNGYVTDIHEFVVDTSTKTKFILAQRVINVDLSQVVNEGNSNTQLLDLIVQELDINNNVLFEWKCFDYLPLNDAVGVYYNGPGIIDYVHCNSIMLDTDTSLLLSSRHFNEITRIDRRNGHIIWRLGTHASTDNFNFINDKGGFSYQHNAQKLPNGNILLFDNGNYRPGPRYSRAVEYKIDEDEMTAEKVWEYDHNQEIMAYFMGGVQRLANGNTLIGWGSSNPTFTEVDSVKHIVYEGSFPLNVMSYRVHKYNIHDIVYSKQPKYLLPYNFTYCKLKDNNFDNKLFFDIQEYVPSNISEDYQLYSLNNNKLRVILKDTLTHFYSYNDRLLKYNQVSLVQNDSLVCSGKGLFKISLKDNCQNSTYLWSNGATTPEINIQTKDHLNKIWVKTTNGIQIQTDTIKLTVSPIDPYEIIGELTLAKPYQIFTYSIPYYKGSTYSWKSINGNLIAGFESNAVQVQWGNKPQGYLQGTITDLYGCTVSSTWDTIFYNSNPSGLEDLYNQYGIHVYPSPFKDKLILDSKNDFQYSLYNILGELQRQSNETILPGENTLDTEQLAAGIYFLNLKTNGQNIQVKLLKE